MSCSNNLFDSTVLRKLYTEATKNSICPQFVAQAKCGCSFLFFVDHRGVWQHDGNHRNDCHYKN